MIFFEPKEEFLIWLKGFVGERNLIEIGCGRDGHLLRKMHAIGIKAIGVDICFDLFDQELPEDLKDSIVPLDATVMFQSLRKEPSLILCCRPCHSGFPGDVMDLAAEGSEMIYVGFKKNIENDVGYPAHMLLDNVGEEEESVFLITK